ncbi:MAG: hypothetical protein ACLPID_06180 [Beijerinckiaceae bacterium]
MVSRSTQTFDFKYPAAFGAGLTAALLCLVIRQGTLPALLIACLTPLPIMIATLGFGWAPGLSAAAIGTGTTFIFMAARPGDFGTAKLVTAAIFAALFALVHGFPAWWLARLARLGRTQAGLPWRDALCRGGDGSAAGKAVARSYYPLSRILGHAVLAAIAIIVSMLIAASLDNGGFDTLVDRWAASIAPHLLEFAGTHELPAGMDLQALSRLYIRLFLPVMTSCYLLLLVTNLWLAGRIVQVSNLLARPWPDIAGELRLPRALALGFLASLASCLLDGLAGAIASCAAAALATGFVLEGLAVTHALTRGIKFRAALLVAIYVSAAIAAFLMLIPFALLGMLGLLDAFFAFRERKPGVVPQKT